jgi:hypothetical protein
MKAGAMQLSPIVAFRGHVQSLETHGYHYIYSPHVILQRSRLIAGWGRD